ncbi:hypothetical protein [Prolixibacter sp. NT017]|uniref:hypothetical protein n=1 Tax=Prolixibacter sp. NT017 TaxID=2652390 RepID=UPI001298F7EA|nr:hypothetical protein [Prolixibacter sp. NT017]
MNHIILPGTGFSVAVIPAENPVSLFGVLAVAGHVLSGKWIFLSPDRLSPSDQSGYFTCREGKRSPMDSQMTSRSTKKAAGWPIYPNGLTNSMAGLQKY